MFKRITLSFVLFFSLISTTFAINTADQLLRDYASPSIGNAKGKITVVEFFDYQCSHCVSMGPTINAVLQANPNVRVVFKDYPIRGELSELAAKAALAANKQGKYYEFQHDLFVSRQRPTLEHLMGIATNLKLNIPQFKRDMNSYAVQRLLHKNINLASELRVSGTPAFFIGKTNAKNMENIQFVLGEMSKSELNTAIQRALNE